MTITYEKNDEATSMASVGAEFVGKLLFPVHRGVLDCRDHFVIFGNDGHKDAIQKPAHTACKHLTCNGCGIYKTRPPLCRGFQCFWLNGWLPEYMKPDEFGVMFSAGPGEVSVTETKQDALIDNWENVCKAIDRINQRAVKKYGMRLEPYFFPLSKRAIRHA
jgi:Fe-S-cluster containining protein